MDVLFVTDEKGHEPFRVKLPELPRRDDMVTLIGPGGGTTSWWVTRITWWIQLKPDAVEGEGARIPEIGLRSVKHPWGR